MSRSTPDLTVDIDPDDSIVVEAATAEHALEEVTRRLGADAEILEAGKVSRGGVGGFFARELVQLRARPRSGAPASTPAAAAPGVHGQEAGRTQQDDSTAEPADGRPQGLDGLLHDLAAATDRQERTFADVLRERLPELGAAAPAALQAAAGTPAPIDLTAPAPSAPAAPAAPAAPVAPTHADPAHAAAAPGAWAATAAGAAGADVRPGPDWSVRNLRKLGLPDVVTDAVADCDPADDLAWIAAISRALGTLCRPLPAGACIYVGPRARRVATAAGVQVVRVEEAAPEHGDFAVAAGASRRVRSWLDWTRQRRWLHVVVGGQDWRDFLFDEPLAVSWSGADDLCEAIRVAAELGLVLAGGSLPGSPRHVSRPSAVDLALAVRDLLPRR